MKLGKNTYSERKEAGELLIIHSSLYSELGVPTKQDYDEDLIFKLAECNIKINKLFLDNGIVLYIENNTKLESFNYFPERS